MDHREQEQHLVENCGCDQNNISRKYEQEWKEIKQRHYKSTKKWLRYLPRRSTFNRHKILKWFGNRLLKRRYLWSFKYKAVRSAFYAGWILTLLPIMGIHTVIAIILSLLLRANIMILIALQIISNPLTIGLLWPAEYQVGKVVFKYLDKNNKLGLQGTATEILGQGAVGTKGEAFIGITLAICIGAVIIGYVCAFISCRLYKYFSRRAAISYEQFVLSKEKKQKAHRRGHVT